MAVQYVVGTSILDGKPIWMLVVPDSADDYQLVGDDERNKYHREEIERLHKESNAPLSKESILDILNMSSSYSTSTGWVDSPDDLEETVRKLTDVYDDATAVSSQREADSRNIANSYADAVHSEWKDDEHGEDSPDLPISPGDYQKYLKNAGVAERYARPGMGYEVPDNWEEIFNGLLGGGGEVAEEILETPAEEVVEEVVEKKTELRSSDAPEPEEES